MLNWFTEVKWCCAGLTPFWDFRDRCNVFSTHSFIPAFSSTYFTLPMLADATKYVQEITIALRFCIHSLLTKAIHSSRRSHFLKKIFFKSGIRTQVLLTTLKIATVLKLPRISISNSGGEGVTIYLELKVRLQQWRSGLGGHRFKSMSWQSLSPRDLLLLSLLLYAYL